MILQMQKDFLQSFKAQMEEIFVRKITVVEQDIFNINTKYETLTQENVRRTTLAVKKHLNELTAAEFLPPILAYEYCTCLE